MRNGWRSHKHEIKITFSDVIHTKIFLIKCLLSTKILQNLINKVFSMWHSYPHLTSKLHFRDTHKDNFLKKNYPLPILSCTSNFLNLLLPSKHVSQKVSYTWNLWFFILRICVENGTQSFFHITWKSGKMMQEVILLMLVFPIEILFYEGFARQCAVVMNTTRTQLELNACSNPLKLTMCLVSTMPTMPCKTKELTGTHSCTLSQFK